MRGLAAAARQTQTQTLVSAADRWVDCDCDCDGPLRIGGRLLPLDRYNSATAQATIVYSNSFTYIHTNIHEHVNTMGSAVAIGKTGTFSSQLVSRSTTPTTAGSEVRAT